MRNIPKNVTVGTPVLVTWVDITSDGTGDPKDAELVKCVTRGFYVGTIVSHGVKALVTSTTKHLTMDKAYGTFDGYDVFPLG